VEKHKEPIFGYFDNLLRLIVIPCHFYNRILITIFVLYYVSMKKTLFILVITFASFSLVSALFINSVLADNPSNCINRYNGTIMSLRINDGHRTIDLSANPLTNFDSRVGIGYTVTLTLHSAAVSASGNKDVGSVMYGSRAYGFADDHCVTGINPNSSITMTITHVFMGQATHGTTQSVDWYSWPLTLPTVTYRVHWY
jgi:hypothetical protein